MRPRDPFVVCLRHDPVSAGGFSSFHDAPHALQWHRLTCENRRSRVRPCSTCLHRVDYRRSLRVAVEVAASVICAVSWLVHAARVSVERMKTFGTLLCCCSAAARKPSGILLFCGGARVIGAHFATRGSRLTDDARRPINAICHRRGAPKSVIRPKPRAAHREGPHESKPEFCGSDAPPTASGAAGAGREPGQR